MIRSDATFPILALCARLPGSPAVAEPLRRHTAAFPWDTLLRDADYHGLEPLLRAHLLDAGLSVPEEVGARLQARWMQHAHAYAVRTRVLAVVLRAMNDAGIPVLILKGAALAHLVYRDPLLRPMRDVDVLIRAEDALRACRVLEECGFSSTGNTVAPDHHHLQGMSNTVDGATVTVELHHQILHATPFLTSLGYDELADRSQAFEWPGTQARTLGREDMLWHVYAHAFATNILRPGIRLISVADLVALTEVWLDELDWDHLRHRYGRAFRALPLLHHLTPWPPHVLERLRWDVRTIPRGVRSIAPALAWSPAAWRDVVCPPEWWLRVRYGIDGRTHWLWYRMVGHPVRFAVAALRAAAARLAKRIRPNRIHILLQRTPSSVGDRDANARGRNADQSAARAA